MILFVTYYEITIESYQSGFSCIIQNARHNF